MLLSSGKVVVTGANCAALVSSDFGSCEAMLSNTQYAIQKLALISDDLLVLGTTSAPRIVLINPNTLELISPQWDVSHKTSVVGILKDGEGGCWTIDDGGTCLHLTARGKKVGLPPRVAICYRRPRFVLL